MKFLGFAYRFFSNFAFLALVYFSLNFMDKYQQRAIVALRARDDEKVGEPVLAYVNRLSDYLFVAARFANDKGAADVLWVPGQNR